MFKIFFTALAALSITLPSLAKASDQSYVLSLFLYNLSDHIRWNASDVNMCLYGQDEVTAFIDEHQFRPLLRIDKLNIIHDASQEDIQSCNMVYIAPNKERHLSKVMDLANANKVVTVSTLPNFTNKGGMIHFDIHRQRVKVDIDYNNLRASKIQLSPLILNAASGSNRG